MCVCTMHCETTTLTWEVDGYSFWHILTASTSKVLKKKTNMDESVDQTIGRSRHYYDLGAAQYCPSSK